MTFNIYVTLSFHEISYATSRNMLTVEDKKFWKEKQKNENEKIKIKLKDKNMKN